MLRRTVIEIKKNPANAGSKGTAKDTSANQKVYR